MKDKNGRKNRVTEAFIKGIKEPVTSVHNVGRFILGWVGVFFILVGASVWFFSWWEVAKFRFSEQETIILFVRIAEYYLVSVTLVFIGRSIIAVAQKLAMEPAEVKSLKEYLFAMVASISAVVFLNIILSIIRVTDLGISLNGLGIEVLYVGLAIASIIIGLALYIFLTNQPTEKAEKGEKPPPAKPPEPLATVIPLEKPPLPENEPPSPPKSP